MANASALARDEEVAERAKFLRQLRAETIASISFLSQAPLSVMDARLGSLQKDLDSIDEQKLETLEEELQAFMLLHMHLPSQETGSRPWSDSKQTSKVNNHATDEPQKFASTSSMSFLSNFPNLKPTPDYKEYSTQELYLRQLAHSRNSGNLGSNVQDIYRPRDEIRKPRSIDEVSIATLLAAGCHLGHAKASWRPSTQYFIYGQYQGIHIIDLNETMVALRRSCSVINGVARKGGIILFVGTSRNWEQLQKLEAAAARCGGYYVSKRWIPGMITNFVEVTKQIGGSVVKEVDMEDNDTGRDFSNWDHELLKPDLVVILNPVENRNCINECTKLRIPTIGLCDTNMEPSLLTYPIPSNDDSPRAVSTILGILLSSARDGMNERIDAARAYNERGAL